MTDEQPPQDPTTGAPGDVPPTPPVTPPAPPPVDGAGWVQPPPAAAPPPVEGSGWVQPPPAPAAPAGPAWGQPQAAPPPVEGSGWVQPPQAPAAAAGPAWGQPQAPAAAPGPAWGQPQAPAPAPAQAGWAQPQPTPGWVQPAVAAQGSVTILARIAGLFLVLLGLFWGLIGVVLIIGGSAFRSILDQFGPLSANGNEVDTAGNIVGGVFVGIGIVILILAIVEVLGGFGALLGKTWGRIIGILYSLVFGAFLLVGLTGATRSAADLGDTSGAGGGLIFLLVMFALYLYSLVVLLIRWRGHARA